MMCLARWHDLARPRETLCPRVELDSRLAGTLDGAASCAARASPRPSHSGMRGAMAEQPDRRTSSGRRYKFQTRPDRAVCSAEPRRGARAGGAGRGGQRIQFVSFTAVPEDWLAGPKEKE